MGIFWMETYIVAAIRSAWSIILWGPLQPPYIFMYGWKRDENIYLKKDSCSQTLTQQNESHFKKGDTKGINLLSLKK